MKTSERASERVVTNGIQKRKRLGLGVLDLWLKDKEFRTFFSERAVCGLRCQSVFGKK